METLVKQRVVEEISHQNSAICDSCGKGFSNLYTLRAHKEQVHEGIKTFECDICHLKFATKYKLQRHRLGIHSEKRDFHCEICGHAFKTRDMLIKHQRTHFQGMGPFVCSLCDQIFKFKSGLDHHNKLKHTVKTAPKESQEKQILLYKCTFCEKIYKTLKHLQRHEEYHQTNEQIKCAIPSCTKVFRNQNDLAKHDREEHKEPVYFSCCYCLKVYKSKSNFEIHLSSHEKENSMDEYQYVIECNDQELEEESTFDQNDWAADESMEETPESLMKNIDESIVSIVRIETERYVEEAEETAEDVNEDIDSTDYLIDEEVDDYLIENDDGIAFYDAIITEELEPPSPLNEADDITQDEFVLSDIAQDEAENCKDVEVQVCSVEIITRQRSQPTKLSNDKQIICDECGSKFKNNSHLKRHIQRKHRRDEYKLECDVCGSKFLLNYDLKRHMIKHSSYRQFSCEQCQQRFKTEVSLKSHIKVLHNQKHLKLDRTFNCQFCERSYFHQRHLQYHMRKHTGDQRYKCELCIPEKLFFYSDAVKWHNIRHHEQPAPFNCRTCSKKFIHEKSLHTHEKEHEQGNGSLVVVCPICEKPVSEKRHLKRHMRGHDDKKFQCKCGDTFKERYQLTK